MIGVGGCVRHAGHVKYQSSKKTVTAIIDPLSEGSGSRGTICLGNQAAGSYVRTCKRLDMTDLRNPMCIRNIALSSLSLMLAHMSYGLGS